MSETEPMQLEPRPAGDAAPAAAAAAPAAAPAAVCRAAPRNSSLLGGIQSMAVTVVIALFVITFAVQAFQIPSESMEDTLLIGDYLLVDKVLYGGTPGWPLLPYREVERGDVVVFRPPHQPEQHFVKRVVGLPGDRIRIVDRQVWINGELLREDYAVYEEGRRRRPAFPAPNSPAFEADAEWREELRVQSRGGALEVPPGEYFVLGDNRDHSLDSRYWGFVPRENVVGRPLLIYFSMQKPSSLTPASAASDATLSRLGQALTHALGSARWERTLRPVR